MTLFQRITTTRLFATAAWTLLAGTGVGCSSAPIDDATSEAHASIEGELVAYGGVMEDGRLVERYSLRAADGAETVLAFAEQPSLARGVRLEVRGEYTGERALRVRDFDIVAPARDDVGSVRQPVTVENGVTTRRAAILKVYWNSHDEMSDEMLRTFAFDAADSAKALMSESSFGKVQFTGDVYQYLQIPNPGDCNSISEIANLAQQAAAAAGIDLAPYDHVGYYVGETNDSTCGWAGWGEVGTPAFPARQTWYRYAYNQIFAHEWGHNLGFWHGHSYFCDGRSLAAPDRCTMYEYGDPYDPMGWGTTQFNAYHKAAQNWYQGCNMVTTPRTGVFTLQASEVSTTGLQALRVPLSPSLCPITYTTQGCYYYVEARKALGVFDGSPTYATSPMTDGALLHANVGIDPTGQSGLTGSYLLDMAPTDYGDFWFSNLAVNRSFGDATGVRLRVLSQTASTVKVAVKVPGGTGNATCMDGTTFAQPSSCSNGMKGAGETDVDCGGTTCVPCDESKRCSLGRDCWSGSCVAGKCAASCTDGLPNGTESDVDCGGACADCANGWNCKSGADCASGYCSGGRCMQDELLATLHVHSDWSEGYCATIDLHNVASTPTWDWSLEIDFTDSSFYNTAGAVFTSKMASTFVLTPDGNHQIWPSSHGTISFCGYKYGPGYLPEIRFVTAQY